MTSVLRHIGIPRVGASRTLATLFTGLLALSVACYLGWLGDPTLAAENHFMENAQAIALLLACLVHGWRASKADRGTVDFTLHMGLSLLCYSFLLRELDISEMDAPGAMAWTWTEHVLRGIGWTCWVFFFVHFARRFKTVWTLRWKLLATPLMVATVCGGVLMASAWPFDKKKVDSISNETSEFIEELLELNGYIILLVAAASEVMPEWRVPAWPTTAPRPDDRRRPALR